MHDSYTWVGITSLLLNWRFSNVSRMTSESEKGIASNFNVDMGA